MANTNRNAADLLARNTSDAYSFDYYGFAAWRACCALLLTSGYNLADAETILRSTLMRYVADSRKSTRATSADFSRTFAQPWVEEYLTELFAENAPTPMPSRAALRLAWSR